MTVKISGKQKFSGTFTVPGDKSISHRSVMLGALSKGTTEVTGFLTGEDCLATISCFRAMGVYIQQNSTNVTIKGGQLSKPTKTLDVGNSGTTLRLMSGILAGQNFTCSITGDESIQKRPMKRVVDPLALMGAQVSGVYAPVTIEGRPLKGIKYTLPVASAQVKSAIILAGLFADGETIVAEPTVTRDHTEIMLKYLGANIKREGNNIIVSKSNLEAKPIAVPGDISSAAFLMAAAAILPDSHIMIKNVGINPTRTGIIHVLRRMGVDIKLHNEGVSCGEPIADIEVKSAPLKATIISGAEIPTLIDEIPAIAAVALFAEGKTIIKDAEELRVKETDRIQAVAEEFGKFFDINPIQPQEDGMVVQGGMPLKAAAVSSRGDHRLAMSLSVLGMAVVGDNETIIENAGCADVSFPGFYQLIQEGGIK